MPFAVFDGVKQIRLHEGQRYFYFGNEKCKARFDFNEFLIGENFKQKTANTV